MDFVIIANAWSAGKDNPTSKHRIALELLRRGNRVLWIEGSGMRTPSVGSAHDRMRMLKKVVAALRGARTEIIDNGPQTIGQEPAKSGIHGFKSKVSSPLSLWVLSPLFIPLPRYEFIRRLNGLICRQCMRFWGWKLGLKDAVLINYVPVLAEAMRVPKRGADPGGRVPAARTAGSNDGLTSKRAADAPQQQQPRPKNPRCAPRIVYHCVDRWDAFSSYDSALMAEMDRRCCEYADIVLASSQDLVDRCRRHSRNVHLLSHGVDHEHFSRAVETTGRPPDLPAGKVAGFFGLLSEWLDQELLVELARRVPDCTLVLIGKADVNVDRLKGVGNIHLLGPRPFGRLPDYVAHFDVGLIPFVVNELTVAVNPIKLREMLAAGCPVVSTALPEVRRCAQEVGVERHVVVAENAEAFVGAVTGMLGRRRTAEERRGISDCAKVESWAGKVNRMLELICAGEGTYGSA